MISFNDVSVAFSPSGDTISWSYNEDIRIINQYGNSPLYIYMQGKSYVKGSTLRSYKNSWPIQCIPPRHKFYYMQLDAFYWEHFSQHPGPECQNTESGFCPICKKREFDREAFEYLINRQTIPRMVFIPHLLNRNTISPTI